MPRRNFFISYKYSPDHAKIVELRQILGNENFFDYGFKELDLKEKSKWKISRYIQYRLWSSSVVIVIVGEETAESDWVDWEIWYSLRTIKKSKVSKRIFKPKGLLALYLPVEKHSVPERLQKNLDSEYAKAIYWEDLDMQFYSKVNEAYNNRGQYDLIKNDLKPRVNPQLPSNRLIEEFKNVLYRFKRYFSKQKKVN